MAKPAVTFSRPSRNAKILVSACIAFGILAFVGSGAAGGGLLFTAIWPVCVMAVTAFSFSVLIAIAANRGRRNDNAAFLASKKIGTVRDKILRPLALGIAVTATSYSVVILCAFLGLFLISNSVAAEMAALESTLKRIPGTHYYDRTDVSHQTVQVAEIIGGKRDVKGAVGAATLETAKGYTGTAESEASTFIRERAIVQGILDLPALLVVGGLLSCFWGILYFPVGCTVLISGRPLRAVFEYKVIVGHIQELGQDYKKLLAAEIVMFAAFLLSVSSGWVLFGTTAGVGIAAFAAPLFSGAAAFYFWVIFSGRYSLRSPI